MNPPLAGVRVIEFGNLVAAPYCGMLLADLGADVVKIEPREGDLARRIGPFVNGESGFFLAVNRGKRSVVIDSKHEQGRHLLWELTRQADVVVHNLRRGAMERMGLGYSELAAANPGLVFAVISAFGSSGPLADRAGIDLVFQGESGMMSLTGGEGDPPQKTATTIADFVAGTNAALLICAALAARGASGRGELVETSLRDGLVAVQGAWNALFFTGGSQPQRTGTASPVTAPNQTFPTADGHLNLAVVSDRHFEVVCSLLGLADLASDPRFGTNEQRVEHRAELATLLASVLSQQPTQRWLELFSEAGIPAGRIMTLPEVFSDPQILHNQMLVEMEHPRAGSLQMAGSPLWAGGEPLLTPRRPPGLGEHTVEVLSSLGIGEDRMGRLLDQGVVYGGKPV